ncbi:hypothetical protein NA56DRAFT_712981 [Hyaloscypha hepaticicola]|uniref:Uncharacterized protein n=1 Tax=Hyaloscypha hepaticicola TaxID=2082293 RepID=A0A2J6PEW6_9HELO|nr:hypothetical protein NA56DRAFT_712981 [Hyaloscypha hepaticicola]
MGTACCNLEIWGGMAIAQPGLPVCLDFESKLDLLSSFRSYLVFTKSTHPLFCVDFAVCTGTTATPLVKLSPILYAWIRITRPGVCFTASLNNESAWLYFICQKFLSPCGIHKLLLPTPLWSCPLYKVNLSSTKNTPGTPFCDSMLSRLPPTYRV